jgi:hypothetical protein
MRAMIATASAIILLASMEAAFAITRLKPSDIQSTFFNGQPFTASTPKSKYRMVFATDGKMMREPLGKRGRKSEGTWKLSKDGYCTTWKGHTTKCFVVVATSKDKWSVMTGKRVAATWTR